MGIDTVFREYNRVCPQESSVLGAFPVCGGMSAVNGSGPCMFGKSTSPVHETLSNRSTWGCLLKCKEFSRTINDVLYVSLTYKFTAYARWKTAGLAQLVFGRIHKTQFWTQKTQIWTLKRTTVPSRASPSGIYIHRSMACSQRTENTGVFPMLSSGTFSYIHACFFRISQNDKS